MFHADRQALLISLLQTQAKPALGPLTFARRLLHHRVPPALKQGALKCALSRRQAPRAWCNRHLVVTQFELLLEVIRRRWPQRGTSPLIVVLVLVDGLAYPVVVLVCRRQLDIPRVTQNDKHAGIVSGGGYRQCL